MVVSGQGTREANLRYHKNKPFYCFVKAPKREKTVFFFDFLKEIAEKDFVAEALSKAGYDLYYYKKETSTLEEDFFVRTADSLIPVEVKAGNTVSKSLRTLIASDHYPEIKEGIKFAHANIGRTETITTFPYFCSFLLKRYLEKR